MLHSRRLKMSIVKISQELHNSARIRAKALNRSINMQIEHWVRIGKLVEENPNMTYRDVWNKLINEAQSEISNAH